jgi:hypothetical protein
MTDTITLRRAAEQARNFLHHLREWDVLSIPNSDGAFWCREIDAALAALDAALAEPKKERAEVAAPARSGVEGKIDTLTGGAYREHVTDGSPCWCNPELNYRDPETGAEVWVHRREQ